MALNLLKFIIEMIDIQVFGKRMKSLKYMDQIEDKYLVLPLYPSMKLSDVRNICKIINSGW